MRPIIYFTLKCIVFAITMTAAAYLADTFLIDRFKSKNIPNFDGRTVYHSICKSKKKTKQKKIIIGDSTANQLFYNFNDENGYYSLACNQAIGVCGLFFLLNNHLNSGNRPEEVYLIYNPSSFSNNLNQIYTYHYFLKPFFKEEYKPFMTQNVINQIKKIPYYQFCQLPFILGTAWAPKYESQDSNDPHFSPISIEYLEKIDSLRSIYHFQLIVVPSFVKEKSKNIEKQFREEINTMGKLKNVMTLYTNSIIYLPDTCFVDNVHLSNPELYKGRILKNMELVKQKTDSISKNGKLLEE